VIELPDASTGPPCLNPAVRNPLRPPLYPPALPPDYVTLLGGSSLLITETIPREDERKEITAFICLPGLIEYFFAERPCASFGSTASTNTKNSASSEDERHVLDQAEARSGIYLSFF